MRPETSGSSRSSDQKRRRRLAGWLSVVFVVALIMGPGPGNRLIRPSPGEPPAIVLGMPVLYVWTIFWFFVMAGVVVSAAVFLWPKEEDPN